MDFYLSAIFACSYMGSISLGTNKPQFNNYLCPENDFYIVRYGNMVIFGLKNYIYGKIPNIISIFPPLTALAVGGYEG